MLQIFSVSIELLTEIALPPVMAREFFLKKYDPIIFIQIGVVGTMPRKRATFMIGEYMQQIILGVHNIKNRHSNAKHGHTFLVHKIESSSK